MEIRPIGAALIKADGRRNMTKLIDALRDRKNAPEVVRFDPQNSSMCFVRILRLKANFSPMQQ